MYPLHKYGVFDYDFSLVVAFIIGISFGFFLERGGLGNARKLAAQFYLTDLTVFKVMFTAIITAMLGLYWLFWLGIVDESLVSLNPTYIIPQLIAGLLFGIGFVVAGLCPGTACVALVTGKLDGLVTLIGIFTGIFVYAELFPFLKEFHFMTSLGPVTLSQFFHISPGIIVFFIVILALAGFTGAEVIERKIPMADVFHKIKDLIMGSVTTKIIILFILILAISAVFTTRRHYYISDLENVIEERIIDRQKVNLIGVHRLADWIIEKKPDFQLMDLRSDRDYKIYHIPYAKNITLKNLYDLETWGIKQLVLYDRGGSIPKEAIEMLRKKNIKVFILKGGMEQWKKTILFPDLSYTSLNAADVEWLRKVSLYFGGDPFIREKIKPESPSKFRREGC